MADHSADDKWFEGKSSLFKSRAERVKADMARRKAGRKAIRGEDVKGRVGGAERGVDGAAGIPGTGL